MILHFCSEISPLQFIHIFCTILETDSADWVAFRMYGCRWTMLRYYHITNRSAISILLLKPAFQSIVSGQQHWTMRCRPSSFSVTLTENKQRKNICRIGTNWYWTDLGLPKAFNWPILYAFWTCLQFAFAAATFDNPRPTPPLWFRSVIFGDSLLIWVLENFEKVDPF